MPDNRFKGTICITGASGDVGAQLSARLLDEGYAVSAWDLAPRDIVNAPEDRHAYHSVDVCNQGSLAMAVEATLSRFGSIDGLVSLAAVHHPKPFLEIDDTTWEQHTAVNMKGALFAAQAVLPHMRQQKSGSIVFFSSLMARTGSAGDAAFTATKGGVLGMARALALAVARDGIRVNIVSPGETDTATTRALLGEVGRREHEAAIPMRRLATPIDLVEAVMLLLDPNNSFMLGQDIRVGGGVGLF